MASLVNITNVNSSFVGNKCSSGAALASRSTMADTLNTVCLNIHCKFLNNLATRLYGGAVLLSETNILFSNCIFAHNKAMSRTGGAVYAIGCKKIDIRNTRFIMNLAGIHGSGLFIYYRFTKHTNQKILRMEISITDSVFSENHVPSTGGAIYILAWFIGNTHSLDVCLRLTLCKFLSNSGIYFPLPWRQGLQQSSIGTAEKLKS